MQLAIIAAIFAAIIGVAFAMQNNVPVTVNFLLWRFDSSLAMVLLLALAFGALVVALLTTPATLRWQWQRARQRKRIAELERACDELRTRIVELEGRPSVDAVAPQRPYVGLKQLLTGRESDSDEKSGPSKD